MSEPIFDHDRLDEYRLSIDYVAFSYRIVKGLTGVNRPARNQWLRAAQSIPRNIAEGNGKQSLKERIGSSKLPVAPRWSLRRFMMCFVCATQSTWSQIAAVNQTCELFRCSLD